MYVYRENDGLLYRLSAACPLIDDLRRCLFELCAYKIRFCLSLAGTTALLHTAGVLSLVNCEGLYRGERNDPHPIARVL